MDLMIEAKMKEQTVLLICKKYGMMPCFNAIPVPVVTEEKDFTEEETEMVGRGRKKHTWKKKGVTVQEEERVSAKSGRKERTKRKKSTRERGGRVH